MVHHLPFKHVCVWVTLHVFVEAKGSPWVFFFRICLFPLPSASITATYHHDHFLYTWVLGTELRSSHLQQVHPWLSHFLSSPSLTTTKSFLLKKKKTIYSNDLKWQYMFINIINMAILNIALIFLIILIYTASFPLRPINFWSLAG